MKLNEKEKQLVEDNLNLVHKVINDKVKCIDLISAYTREDLFQIGCIGLCKAAATDKGGCFSTYAYRLIWNEICDALITNTRKWSREITTDMKEDKCQDIRYDYGFIALLNKLSRNVSATRKKGIYAIMWMDQGYSAREIGDVYEVKANLVTAWISKAKSYLRSCEELKCYLSD